VAKLISLLGVVVSPLANIYETHPMCSSLITAVLNSPAT